MLLIKVSSTWNEENVTAFQAIKLGYSYNYMPPILVSSSAKRIATQLLVITKLNRRKYFILRGFVCDIKRPSNELLVQR